MTTWRNIHLQGRAEITDVATVANWLIANGEEISSMSQLVQLTFETLAASIVASGGEGIHEEQAQATLSSIGMKRTRHAKSVPLARDVGTQSVPSETLRSALSHLMRGTSRAKYEERDNGADHESNIR